MNNIDLINCGILNCNGLGLNSVPGEFRIFRYGSKRYLDISNGERYSELIKGHRHLINKLRLFLKKLHLYVSSIVFELIDIF
jgi:hypothetical protein